MNIHKKDRLIILAVSIILTTGLSVLVIKGVDRASEMTASVSDSASNSPCPPDMVFIDFTAGGFCIDRYENAAGPNCYHQDPANETETNVNIEDSDCIPVSQVSDTPWTNITQNQARLACNKAGKRLPTNKEWFQAALGTPDPASGWTSQDCQVDSNWKSQPGLTGSGENCLSSSGAYDMIGNIWEWVEGTVFDGSYEDHKMPEQGFVQDVDSEGLAYETDFNEASEGYHSDYFWIRSQGVRGIARGGYWNNQADAGIYAAYLVVPPSFSGVGMGFRCVK